MNFYPFHIGDYASATRHLSWIEDAAYRRLLDVYYVREEPIPADIRQVYRLTVASSEEERTAVDTIIAEFFTLTDRGYEHARCEMEIHKAQSKRDKASQSAQTRWSNATGNNNAMLEESERNANASKQQCERTEISINGNAPNPNPIPNPEVNTIRDPDGFAEFWDAYPKKVGKGEARKAFAKARINGHLPEVLKAIEIQSRSDQWRRDGGQYIPNPATWLNQGRWEDGPTGGTSTGNVVADFMREHCL